MRPRRHSRPRTRRASAPAPAPATSAAEGDDSDDEDPAEVPPETTEASYLDAALAELRSKRCGDWDADDGALRVTARRPLPGSVGGKYAKRVYLP